MKKICLIGHGQPSRNPRLVRDANCLTDLGYSVTVITPRILRAWVEYDNEIIDNANWEYIYLDFIDNPFNKLYWHYVRFRNRISRLISQYVILEYFVTNAVEYLNQELSAKAAKIKSDLYIAHQQQALPAAAWAAARNKSKYAVDIHDLLSDCSSEPVHLFNYIEQKYLKECVYISTMSATAATRLAESRHLLSLPIVRYNTQKIKDREDLIHPNQRQHSQGHSQKPISIYWFGQTIGYHSRADQVLRAIPLLSKPVKLILRGHPNFKFVNYLISLAKDLNISDCLEIKPIASPNSMVKIAADYDILLGSQPEKDLFHQMAIGNKVFTGMMAGLALALTDTVAHRQFIHENPDCGFLFPDQNEKALAEKLNEIFADDNSLINMKVKSWDLATNLFNCERECEQFAKVIASL